MIWQLFISAGLLFEPLSLNSKIAYEKTGPVSHSNWEEVKNNNGVKTYVRWCEYGNGRRSRERKGEMLANCSMQKAIETLTDTDATMKWMTGVSENYLLSQANPAEWYTYTLYNIPWPFNKRDLVSAYRLENGSGNSGTVIRVYSRGSYIPLKPGIERLTDYTATWSVTEITPQQVHIVFSATSGTPPLFPRYIQDPVIEKIFHNDLVRLRELLSE